MLEINFPRIKNTQDLKTALQNAIRLEHSTIPPYLTAWWTLRESSPGASAARELLSDIWLDEMHHMLAVCNLLNALGGTPILNQPGFVPEYPGSLPMTIGASGGVGFEVGLRRYSKALVTDTFMKIEAPETPIVIPEKPAAVAFDLEILDHYRTIGEFYAAVADVIRQGGETLFSTPSSPQVSHAEVKPITDVASAVAAIELIRHQGEGTPQCPEVTQGTFAHYYRFQSLSKGEELGTSADGKPYFDPAKPIVIDDVADVIQMVDDPRLVDTSQDPDAEQKARAFDQEYRVVLDRLHDTVNGQPGKLFAATTMMYSLSDLASDLLEHEISAGPDAGQLMGPRFLVA